jgi:hypothetical protein
LHVAWGLVGCLCIFTKQSLDRCTWTMPCKNLLTSYSVLSRFDAWHERLLYLNWKFVF